MYRLLSPHILQDAIAQGRFFGRRGRVLALLQRSTEMARSVFGKVMWVGRATVFLVGLAVILALVFGAASVAFGPTTSL
jgi:hypothetical protein